MKTLDCLFVHTGHRAGSRWEIPIMPAGLLVLAQYLKKHSVSCGIISLPHASSEEARVENLARKYRAKILCLPLHWHLQAGEVLALCARLKKSCPDLPIVLGGYTASFFAREILIGYPQIDFVIRGDGEEPLLKLARRLLGGRKYYADIPNLAWRDGGGAVLNKMGYSAGSRVFSGLELTDLSSILNKNDRPSHGLCFEDDRFTYVCGRGCPHNCSYCGGGRAAQKRLNARTVTVAKSADDIIEDLGKLWQQGVRKILFPHNPFQNENLFLEVLKRLGPAKLNIELKMDFCGLPSGDFLYNFSQALGPRSKITAFVTSGSEEVRRKNKAQHYSNDELFSVLEEARRLGVKLWPTFSTGLPFETRKDLLATVAVMEKIRRCKLGAFGTYTFSAEPCSPYYLAPAAHGIRLRRKTLEDFMSQKGQHDLGYATGHFTEKEIARNARLLARIAKQ